MTPPRPTAPTAAELRANFAHYYCPVHAIHGCTRPCDWLAELDVLLAAARAEAVAPLEARVAELESERGALVEADILLRARVGKVLNVLRQFMKAMPKCEWDEYECKKVATHHAYKQQFFCAAHQFASDVQPVEWAAPLRAALALLAADKAGAKAGKP